MTLAIRTDSAAELYLLDGLKPKDSEIWEAGRELSAQILSKIQQLLRRNQLDFKDLTGIIAFKGPGSFTGLRIGISVGNSMAYGLGIPIVGSTGENWLTKGAKAIKLGSTGNYVMPEYGAEPHITKPRK